MRRYRFRLARVLRVRRLQQDMLRAAWLEARAKADAAQAAEAAQREALELARDDLARLQSTGELDPRAVLLQQDLCARAERELARRAAFTHKLEAEAARRSDALREARTAVRGLERLDERRRRAHVDERDRLEQAQTDEVAARRFSAEPQPASQRAAAALERALAPALETTTSSPDGPAADSDRGGLPQPHPAP